MRQRAATTAAYLVVPKENLSADARVSRMALVTAVNSVALWGTPLVGRLAERKAESTVDRSAAPWAACLVPRTA